MTDDIAPELDLDLAACGRNRTVEAIRDSLAAWLRAHPESGGRRLTPVSRLAARLGVARQTVRKAYDLLEADGMLRRDSNGNGWYPVPLPRQENRCIGILLPLSFLEYCSRDRRWGERNLGFYSGIVTRASELGLATRPFRLPPPEAPEEEAEQAAREAEQSFSGLILFGDRGYRNDPPLRRLLALPGLPKVSLDSEFDLEGIGSVGFSTEALAQSVMQYLRRFGHRNICVIHPVTYPRECSCTYPMLDRKQVLDPFCRAALEGERILEICSGRQEFGEIFHRKVAAMLRRPVPPTAFWCRSDLIARELLPHFLPISATRDGRATSSPGNFSACSGWRESGCRTTSRSSASTTFPNRQKNIRRSPPCATRPSKPDTRRWTGWSCSAARESGPPPAPCVWRRR